MLLIGLFLCPDASGNDIHPMYLALLNDIDKIRTYSWGSATLSHLYQSLCNNAIENLGNFTGCGVLLQAWGWSRMTNLAPIQQNNFEFPYATRWSSLGMNYENCPHYSITQYRNLIDHLGQDDFIWRPYLGLEFMKLKNTTLQCGVQRCRLSTSPPWKCTAVIVSSFSLECCKIFHVRQNASPTSITPLKSPTNGNILHGPSMQNMSVVNGSITAILFCPTLCCHTRENSLSNT
ncbi:unnamed protein product [Lathyrus sativus]|nr:unnamed protein product [Lathyrus sativus]